jgi:hypothetical protein
MRAAGSPESLASCDGSRSNLTRLLADFLLEKFLHDEVALLAFGRMLVKAARALSERVMIRKNRSAREATLIDRGRFSLPLAFSASGAAAERRRFPWL